MPIRKCPATGWPCFKALPKGHITIRVNGRHDVCSFDCAEDYAKRKNEIVIREHRTSGPAGIEIGWYTGERQRNAEKHEPDPQETKK